MARRLTTLLAALAMLTLVPAGAEHLEDSSSPDPRHRLDALVPKPAGTFDTIVLQYGPYLVHPGSDLTRADLEVVSHNFQVIAARPSVRFQDGTEPTDLHVHIHHAHWVKPNPNNTGTYYDWFFGTGEEKTRGGGWDYMRADTETWDAGRRASIPMTQGEQMLFISMLHNKTATPLPLWIEGRFEIVWGSREEIKAATAGNPDHPLWSEGGGGNYSPEVIEAGLDFRPLTPVLHGDSFQVPKIGGDYVYPRDVGITPNDPNRGSVRARAEAFTRANGIFDEVGHVWTAPYDGAIVIGAGHLHPGGKQVIVSNLGSPDAPCGESFLADPDSDGFPGARMLAIDTYYRDADPNAFRTAEELAGTMYFPSEEFQMGITQMGWRTYVRQGDRIAINGIYDTTNYAFPDAMSFFGFYVDRERAVGAEDACRTELVTDPGASLAEITRSTANRPWETDGLHGDPNHLWCNPCDRANPVTTLGQWTPTVHIAGFLYAPGDLQTLSQTGVPWVNRGEEITFVNEDWAGALVRHSITTCAWPCNGPYRANYPFHDGVADSGSIGFTPVETYEIGTDEPWWTLDTGDLDAGLYSYYCRLHPWMRGAFAVQDA